MPAEAANLEGLKPVRPYFGGIVSLAKVSGAADCLPNVYARRRSGVCCRAQETISQSIESSSLSSKST